MCCEDKIALMEEYLDGELDEARSSGLRAHMSACTECRAEFAMLQREQSAYSDYDNGIEVRPSLWAGIEEKITKPEPERAGLLNRIKLLFLPQSFTPAYGLAASAALIILAVVATVIVMRSLESGKVSFQPGSSPQAPGLVDKTPGVVEPPLEPDQPFGLPPKLTKVGNTTKPRQSTQTAMQLAREAEQKYLQAIALLSREARINRRSLDPVVAAKFEESLRAIDRTIAETRQAVRQHPDDPMAVQYMLIAYGKKVEVLREMART
jgi:hypothetical protein